MSRYVIEDSDSVSWLRRLLLEDARSNYGFLDQHLLPGQIILCGIDDQSQHACTVKAVVSTAFNPSHLPLLIFHMHNS